MEHYEGLFNREFLPWCKQQGLFDIAEIGLEQITKFRNQLSNKGSVNNRKLSRLRSFLAFCMDRRWIGENPAKKVKPANEDEPTVDYFHPEEMQKLLDPCFTSHKWERGHLTMSTGIGCWVDSVNLLGNRAVIGWPSLLSLHLQTRPDHWRPSRAAELKRTATEQQRAERH
jgi:hypothetical protein